LGKDLRLARCRSLYLPNRCDVTIKALFHSFIVIAGELRSSIILRPIPVTICTYCHWARTSTFLIIMRPLLKTLFSCCHPIYSPASMPASHPRQFRKRTHGAMISAGISGDWDRYFSSLEVQMELGEQEMYHLPLRLRKFCKG
jgi:hypothetical protein